VANHCLRHWTQLRKLPSLKQLLQLATKLYGVEKAEQWELKVEVAAPAQAITQIRIKPNPEYAANVTSPLARRPVAQSGRRANHWPKAGTNTGTGPGVSASSPVQVPPRRKGSP
jgi:hypothetical protein